MDPDIKDQAKGVIAIMAYGDYDGHDNTTKGYIASVFIHMIEDAIPYVFGKKYINIIKQVLYTSGGENYISNYRSKILKIALNDMDNVEVYMNMFTTTGYKYDIIDNHQMITSIAYYIIDDPKNVKLYVKMIKKITKEQ